MALLDDSGKVIHLNNADQKYIRKDLKKIFGFPKGKIRIGELPSEGFKWVIIGGQIALKDDKVVCDTLGRSVRS